MHSNDPAGMVRIFFDTQAQPADVDIYYLGFPTELGSPNTCQQLLCGDNPIGLESQGMQQIEFARPQIDRATGDHHGMRAGINDQVPQDD